MEGTVSADVRRLGDTMCVVDISGDVTADSEQALMEAYNEACSPQTRAVLLNFSGLEYMNSGGIGLLVTLLVRANRQGHQLMATGLNEHYRQIFELTRLDEAITIHESEGDVLAAVER